MALLFMICVFLFVCCGGIQNLKLNNAPSYNLALEEDCAAFALVSERNVTYHTRVRAFVYVL